MKEIPTTLRRRALSELTPLALKERIEDQRTRAIAALDPGDYASARHIGALSAFSNFLGERGLPVSDPHMWALDLQQRAVGAIADGDPFITGVNQTKLLAQLATTAAGAPDPGTTLDELVGAGIEDLIEHFQGVVGAAHRERDAAVEEASQKASDAARANAADAEARAAREEADGLRGDLQEARSTIAYFREQGVETRHDQEVAALPADASESPKPEKPKEPPRRTAIKGRKGLYITNTNKLCMGYTDGEGKQRWKTLGNPEDAAELEAAEELRAELQGKPFEPEMSDDREAVTA